MIDIVEKTVQVTYSKPGHFGGGFFVGEVVDSHEEIKCVVGVKVSYNVPRKGEFWKVKGWFEDHQIHGIRLHVTECNPVSLPTEKYVWNMLKYHPAFTGFYLGKKKVELLKSAFEAVDLVKHLNDGNVDALAEVIYFPIAKATVEAWKNLGEEVETINFLLGHKFPPEVAHRVISLCRYDTIERLKKNPYALICFGGIAKNIWRTVEVCAKKIGFTSKDPLRLIGAVEHALYVHLREGHTAMPVSELIEAANKLLRSKTQGEEGVRLALLKNVVCAINHEPEPLIQLYGPAIIESQLEKRIEALVSSPKQWNLFGRVDESHVKVMVDDYCARQAASGGMVFNARQKDAIAMALNSRVCVLSGYGGTGKTTVLKAVIDIAKVIPPRRKSYIFALAAKAKERAKQATGGHEASFTIHAFINAVKKGAKDIDLDNDPLFIIDEASMVDVALFNELLALMDGKSFSLLAVGDTKQLSPVGFGVVYHRLVKLDMIPSVHLTETYRQGSALHDFAMAIRDDDVDPADIDIPVWNGEDEGVYFVPSDMYTVRDTLLEIKKKEKVRGGTLPTVQILTPHMSDRMRDSGNKINRLLQNELAGDKHGIRLGLHWLREGDPVIVTENDYDKGLFNGTTGVLKQIEVVKDQITGVFNLDGYDGDVRLTHEELYGVSMRPAYAFTVHKSQGSEYDATVVTCVQDSPMVESSLIYTAVTRAKKLCLIVGDIDLFRKAVGKEPRAETLCCGFFLHRLLPQMRKAS